MLVLMLDAQEGRYGNAVHVRKVMSSFFGLHSNDGFESVPC